MTTRPVPASSLDILGKPEAQKADTASREQTEQGDTVHRAVESATEQHAEDETDLCPTRRRS